MHVRSGIRVLPLVFLGAVLLGSVIAVPAAAAPAVGFIAAAASPEKMGAEAKAAWQVAARLATARLILCPSDGTFVDDRGQAVVLDTFGVLWHHEGDSVELTAAQGPRSIQALRKRVADGGGLLLSGSALAMVHSLGIEPAVPRRGAGGQDDYFAQVIPVRTHPVFDGLVAPQAERKAIPISDAGYQAYSDFQGTGGPTTGMLLGRAASAAENPLAEYACGKGRVIVMGWRLPFYSHTHNAHRSNLERLTGNCLTYLGSSSLWQKIVLDSRPVPASARPGVPPDQWEPLALAITDLGRTFEGRYPKAADYLARLEAMRKAHDQAQRELASGGEGKAAALSKLAELVQEFSALRQEALLANPLMQFERLLLVERSAANLALPANHESNATGIRSGNLNNRLCVLSPVRPEGTLATLYQPPTGTFVGDLCLHFDADRVLFSMPGANGRWQIHELSLASPTLPAAPGAPRELPLIREADVDNYDACYLPDGRVLFTSTAPFVGVPCVYGGAHVTNMYQLQLDGSIRQLTVDQEHNWSPRVLNNGRVLYLRWEYADLPHAHSRRLFHMNPDGTGQMEYMSSNSYFPNSFFYAKPIPGHPSKVVGIASGHHGNARIGRLLILDPARGRQEADGVVQEIPGRGRQVQPIIRDQLADGVFPQFLHPWPLSEKYFLVSCRPAPHSPWGVYLVDVFDNMLLLKESPGQALLEPIPLAPAPRPPVIADRVDLARNDAVVYMSDVYRGPGLRGIPRGAVKKLRVFTYHYSYRGMGGLLGAIGMDGPWDIRRVLGTVPVEADGSAAFRVPARTPIAVQPLDGEGKALQLMRSWFTAMPGESISCVGCHEQQNTPPPNSQSIAARRTPSEIEPWHGPVRGFAFCREVQPVLDAHCVRCHNGSTSSPLDGSKIADFRADQRITDWSSAIAGHVNPSVGGKFSTAYAELHRFVRRPGIESDIHLLSPMDYHADSTELVQMLRKGHHGVRLDAESWDRIVTWIDLNAPYHGTWTEIVGRGAVQNVSARKREMMRRYAGIDEDPELIPPLATIPAPPAGAPAPAAPLAPPACPGWPFDAEQARARQGPADQARRTVELAEGVTIELVRIPAGEFIMGSPSGADDEKPPCRVRIDKPFWIARTEITNRQFATFDPRHDSHYESMHGYQFGMHGYAMDKPAQPAVRLSWNQAMAFCRHLSAKTGLKFNLPTEAQWEYACRAGSGGPFWYGGPDSDFSKLANLGDAKLSEFALDTFIRVRVIAKPNKYDDWVPKDARFNDGVFVTADAGSYQPNPWGLFDMHGNAAEWTRSAYRPYPWADDGRDDPAGAERRVARGGSWYDRPKRCTSSHRLPYQPYQPVFNVGFRVVIEE
ncbi:MAG: Formylglycine-generating sulfatase enzyme [Planctomycetes bacterium ADurb.Bin126]|nr:MAG: Formylglycine-generating sulfatase enzyme [Planctomycetes bacterium ADurb.Bin126]HOD79892.1 SUMF1/EgtB/PvdO family nonheme iron enzyme [Phycisphaerae bacterium]